MADWFEGDVFLHIGDQPSATKVCIYSVGANGGESLDGWAVAFLCQLGFLNKGNVDFLTRNSLSSSILTCERIPFDGS